MDPALPASVERALRRCLAAPGDAICDGADIGTFIVAAAAMGCRIYADLAARTDRPSTGYLARRLRSEMGIDEGMSPDHDNVIDTIVGELTNQPSRA